MIVIGIILVLLGWALPMHALLVVGVIVLAIGLVLLIVGQTGHAVGGRSHWY